MACIISFAKDKSLGAISLTNPEFLKAQSNAAVQSALARVRGRYLVGVHHNWHPVRTALDESVDFHLLPRDQFNGPAPVSTRLVDLDACNFSPVEFQPSEEPPTWDVLIVGRSVKFKRPALALETIRHLTELRPNLRVLFISPMPPRTPLSWRSVDHGLPRRYEGMFSVAERDNVTLLSPRENYPFPFTRRDLAVFYRASRVFAHFAPEETRCRVAAYAWASGLPVIGTRGIGDLLPPELLIEPAFYEVKNDLYVPAMLAALDRDEAFDSAAYRDVVGSTASVLKLVQWLNELPRSDGRMTPDRVLSANLDIRLGWHHGSGDDVNGPGRSLLALLESLEGTRGEVGPLVASSAYPEREMDSCSGAI